MKRVILMMALASGSALGANICVQNKQTGLYESTSRDPGSIKECQALNPSVIEPSKVIGGRPVSPTINSQTPTGPLRYRFEGYDLSYRSVLMRWASLGGGWQIIWEADRDFPGRVMAEFSNDFEEAIKMSVDAYRNSDYPIKACVYTNRVVRIVRFQGTGTECDLS